MGCDNTSKQDDVNFSEAPAQRSTLGAQWLAANYQRAPLVTVAERLRASQDMSARAQLAAKSLTEQAASDAHAPEPSALGEARLDDRPVWQRLAPMDSWTLPLCEQSVEGARASGFSQRQDAATGDDFTPPWQTPLELQTRRAAGAGLLLALFAGLWMLWPQLTPVLSFAPAALQAAGDKVGEAELAVAAAADLTGGAATAFALTPAPPNETPQKSETMKNIAEVAAGAVSGWAGRFAAATYELADRAAAMGASSARPSQGPLQSAAGIGLAPRPKTRVSATAPAPARRSLARRAAATPKPPARPVTAGAAAATPLDQITRGIDVAGTGAQSGLTNLVIGVRRLLAPPKRGASG